YDQSNEASVEGAPQMRLGDLGVEFLEIEEPVSMLDLTITIVDENESLSAGVQYNTDLFARSTIESIANDLKSILQIAVRDPRVIICDLSLSANGVNLAGTPPLARSSEVQHRQISYQDKVCSVDISLFCSAVHLGAPGAEGFLLTAARFADEAGFDAVWLPPEDSGKHLATSCGSAVIGSAVAAITRNVHIRAGGVYAPEASPVRIAEEWSVVDNLSNGRAGIAVAGAEIEGSGSRSGNQGAWTSLSAFIQIVRSLWRGEKVSLPGVGGRAVQLATLPRPIQEHLPLWVVATDEEGAHVAGELGAGLLVHAADVAADGLGAHAFSVPVRVVAMIHAYRKAFDKAQNFGSSRVTLVVPAFVSCDKKWNDVAATVALHSITSESARGVEVPHIESLEVRGSAPMDSTERPWILCGSPDRCLDQILNMNGLGVDEVACWIDFGLGIDSIQSGFDGLREVAKGRKPAVSAELVSPSLGGQTPIDEADISADEVRDRAQTRREMMRRQRRQKKVSFDRDQG
ncbi:MAG: LLM class flavin-dependent oxidoreductase, partial [Blastocatellia bacterium]